MKKKHGSSPVFTPGDEPYLGRESVFAFDKLIVSCLEANSDIAPLTHHMNLTELQKAACQLIPAGISLALSIRELVRQGYLYGALVLVRPLAERAMILQWLHENQDKIGIWTRGWKHKERPTLARMIDDVMKILIAEEETELSDESGRELVRSLNSLTHGDPDSGIWNLITIEDGKQGHAVSKILDRTDLCDQACFEAIGWLVIILGLMAAIFPQHKAPESVQ
jgi:hypothetical protein